MAAVVRGGGGAGSGALTSIIETREILDAHVGILAGSIERSVDSTAEASWAVVAVTRSWWVVLGVAIGASNDDVKVIAVLPIVDSRLGGNAGAPKGALDVGEAWWVWAVGTRVHCRIALEVDVEGCAEVDSVAELLALDCVIGLKSIQAHVAVGIHGCLEVDEGSAVALGCRCIIRSVLQSVSEKTMRVSARRTWKICRPKNASTVSGVAFGPNPLGCVAQSPRFSMLWSSRISRFDEPLELRSAMTAAEADAAATGAS